MNSSAYEEKVCGAQNVRTECAPPADPEPDNDAKATQWVFKPLITVYAKVDIVAGTELLNDYGKNFHSK
jgi:hypothetical protein